MNNISTATPLAVCVYCGSRSGVDPQFVASAQQVGTLIGRLGWRLVYGGGRSGLMGAVADAALAAGAEVTGIIPLSLMEREVGHRGLTHLHVVDTMHQRKQMMAERSDMFLALAGGIGTFEELFEVWTWRQLGYHDKPLGLLNVAGYYDTLLNFMHATVEQGFVAPDQHEVLQVDTDVQRLLDRLGALARVANLPDDYQRI